MRPTIVLIALCLFLNSCSGSCQPIGDGILGGGPSGCVDAVGCIYVETDNVNCYTDPSGGGHNYLVGHNTNTYDVYATFKKEWLEKTERGSVWHPVLPVDSYSHLRTIQKSDYTRLGCSSEIIDGVRRDVRWLIEEACKLGDSNCLFTRPANADVPPMSCDPSKTCKSCMEIAYKDLGSSAVQSAVAELYVNLMRKHTKQYNFKTDLSGVFALSSYTAACKARISKINLSKPLNIFSSDGATDCTVAMGIAPAIQFGNSNETYSKLSLDLPPSVAGKITLGTNMSTLELDRDHGKSLRMKVLLDPSGTLRQDYVGKIEAYRQGKTIIVTGDFICVKITNINPEIPLVTKN